ncbi:hypothetical protein LYSHEL_02740 [Lysobacter helvus]|uniref:DUF2185 domain-containing protein n=2 Tax=Lysobacteraceae TaxID=32033 RepID=A0ABN6FNW1_9GAMM|nr:hypothetical protein LYSCAS_02740 [Lysobacter caseinilyticus]BCT94403.1 hypothetical protein LYSHEL_02740 [Lysobacter helvus]
MWYFDQTPDTAALVSKSVVYDGHPILFVAHDEDDHGWQFLDGADPPSDVVVVEMSHPVDMDPSLLDLADLPPGWCAWRDSIDGPWTREALPAD